MYTSSYGVWQLEVSGLRAFGVDAMKTRLGFLGGLASMTSLLLAASRRRDLLDEETLSASATDSCSQPVICKVASGMILERD